MRCVHCFFTEEARRQAAQEIADDHSAVGAYSETLGGKLRHPDHRGRASRFTRKDLPEVVARFIKQPARIGLPDVERGHPAADHSRRLPHPR